MGETSGTTTENRPAILVVDTDAERRRALAEGLAREGYEVVPAGSSEEGKRFVEGLGPGIVVAPVGMPGFDGPEILGASGERTLLLLGQDVSEGEDVDERVLFLPVRDLAGEERTRRVRLALIGREVGLDPDDQLASLVGDFALTPFLPVVERLARARVDGRLRTLRAEIVFRDGRVVAAATGRVSGLKAFCRIARVADGPFRVEAGRFEGRGEPIDFTGADLLDRAREDLQRELPDVHREVAIESGSGAAGGLGRILEDLGACRTVGDVLDHLPAPDGQVADTIDRLVEAGLLRVIAPRLAVSVLTDSTADLPPDLAARLDIRVIPLSIVFGDDVLRDGIDLRPRDFYELLETSEDHPSTRPPSEDEFHAVLQDLAAERDVLAIHLSSRLSQTLAHASAAAARGLVGVEQAVVGADPRAELVDSRSVSMGLGLQVVFAARMLRRGLGLDEVRGRLEALSMRIHVLFVVDTLEYLRRGGRVGKAGAWIGTLLGIKPILGVRGGVVVPVDKVRGGRRAHPRIVRLVEDRVDRSKPIVAAVAHSKAPVWADRLRKLLEDRFDVSEMLQTDIGPVVGTHAGPGCVGCVVFQPEGDEAELFAPLE